VLAAAVLSDQAERADDRRRTISLTNASLLTVELSSVYLFVGLNGAFTRDADNM